MPAIISLQKLCDIIKILPGGIWQICKRSVTCEVPYASLINDAINLWLTTSILIKEDSSTWIQYHLNWIHRLTRILEFFSSHNSIADKMMSVMNLAIVIADARSTHALKHSCFCCTSNFIWESKNTRRGMLLFGTSKLKINRILQMIFMI